MVQYKDIPISKREPFITMLVYYAVSRNKNLTREEADILLYDFAFFSEHEQGYSLSEVSRYIINSHIQKLPSSDDLFFDAPISINYSSIIPANVWNEEIQLFHEHSKDEIKKYDGWYIDFVQIIHYPLLENGLEYLNFTLRSDFHIRNKEGNTLIIANCGEFIRDKHILSNENKIYPRRRYVNKYMEITRTKRFDHEYVLSVKPAKQSISLNAFLGESERIIRVEFSLIPDYDTYNPSVPHTT